MQAGFTFLQNVFVVNAREILYEYVCILYFYKKIRKNACKVKGFLKGLGHEIEFKYFGKLLGGPPISIISHAFPLTAGKMANAIPHHEERLRKLKTSRARSINFV